MVQRAQQSRSDDERAELVRARPSSMEFVPGMFWMGRAELRVGAASLPPLRSSMGERVTASSSAVAIS